MNDWSVAHTGEGDFKIKYNDKTCKKGLDVDSCCSVCGN